MGNGTPRYRLQGIAVVLSLVTVISLVWGCQDDSPPPPDEVIKSFITDLRRGDRQLAMQALWPPTREEIEGAYEELEASLGQKPPIDREELLVVTRLESPMLISDIAIDGGVPRDREHGQAVVVNLEFRDGQAAEVTARWDQEQRRWFVDLPLQERRRLDIWFDERAEEAPVGEDGPQIDEQDRRPADEGQDGDDDGAESVRGEAIDDE